MKVLFEFLSSKNQLSSKRLAFLLGVLVYIVGTVYFVNKLIEQSEFEIAATLWNCFAVVVLILGGYVTADIIERIMNRK